MFPKNMMGRRSRQLMALADLVSRHGDLVPVSGFDEGMSYGGLWPIPGAEEEAMAEQLPSTSDEASNVDTIINGIIKAVTEDTSSTYLCSHCKEKSASFRCKDCPDILCNRCVRVHQTVTIEHRMERLSISSVDRCSASTSSPFNIPQSISPSSICSSMTSFSPPSLLSPLSNVCDRHFEPLQYFCSRCSLPACSECINLDHPLHDMVYLHEAVEKARAAAIALQNEIRAKTMSVREAVDGNQRMIVNVALRSDQAENHIKGIFRRYIQILEDRERYLLSRVEAVRTVKLRLLSNQMEDYHALLNSLCRAGQHVTHSLEKGGIDVISATRRAQSEVALLRLAHADLAPCEDDHVVFVPPDGAFLRSLTRAGFLTTSGAGLGAVSGAQQDRPGELALVGPGELNRAPGGYLAPHAGLGRPIFGYTKAVVCREARGITPYLIFGSEGSENGEICRPWGVCCHNSGVFIVADRSNNRIQLFNPDGTFRFKFGTKGSEYGQFEKPAGVAVDHKDRIIVADKDNHRIQIFQMDGTFIAAFGSKGSRVGQFNYPWDVACNSIGNIIVSDTRNHRVQMFNPQGVFINKYGFDGPGNNYKHFDSPRGVCFTPTGSIIVTDFNNHRMVIIDAHMSKAQMIGTEGGGLRQFLRPQGIVCDDEGRIVVADSRNNRIQVFNSYGEFLFKIGQAGKGPGELDRPSGVCLTPQGRIAVVDFGNNRVQIY